MMGIKMNDQKHNSLYDRINKLLISYDWSDCSFLLNDKEFKAHKLILGISSPVFEAMFYGPLSACHNVVITDIDPSTFQLLLNFIYTDKVNISSIEEAYDLLYVAKKYLLDSLSTICIDYILKNMSIDNVITILNYPEYMQGSELVTSARKLFCQHANYLFQEHISKISLTCLTLILESDEINISEQHLIRYVFEWTKYYCEQNNIPKDKQNRREILLSNGLFDLLRFNVMCLNDMKKLLSDENNLLLSHDVVMKSEAIASMQTTNSVSLKTNLINTDAMLRTPIKIQWHLCHRAPIRSESPIFINSQNYSIQTWFKSNKSSFINSLQVLSRMAPVDNFYCNPNNVYSEELRISIFSELDNSIIRNISFKKEIEYDTTIDIKFEEVLCIKKDNWYRINFNWPGLCTYDKHLYGVQSRDLCYSNNNIIFKFQDMAPMSSKSVGSFLKGLKFCM